MERISPDNLELDQSIRKPVVIFVEGEGDKLTGLRNFDRDALIYVLENDLRCHVVLFEDTYAVTHSCRPAVQQLRQKPIITAIIVQDYFRDHHFSCSATLRNTLNPLLPVIFIPNPGSDDPISPPDSNSFVFKHDDPELLQLLTNLLDYYNYQDVISSEVDNLIYAYQALHADSLGTPVYKEQAVIQALRIKLSPSEIVSTEYEEALNSELPPIKHLPDINFQKDLDRIRGLSSEDRDLFNNELLLAENYQRSPGGGLLRVRVELGNKVAGFAIDPLSLEQLVTNRKGEHYYAGHILSRKLGYVGCLRQGISYQQLSNTDRNLIEDRIITGLLFFDISGYSTPIALLKTYDVDPQSLLKVARHFIARNQCIPVDHEGRLIE